MNKCWKREWIKESVWIIAVILLMSLIVFRRYIFEGYYLLSQGVMSDILRANLPTYVQMYDSLFTDHNFWSWKMGIGTSMFTHADVYFDPFVYILFVKGREGIQSMLIWMMVIKLVAEGLTMGAYLRYFKLKPEAVVIASCMYAFSGYSLVMGNNFALGTILVYVPLVCLGIEKWLNENKKGLLLLSLFLTCIYSYYFFFCFGLLTALYLAVRAKQKQIRVIPKLVSLALIAFAAIGLSLFSLLPQAELVLASDRVAGAKDVETGAALLIPQFRVLATALARTVSNDFFGNRVITEYWGYAYNWSRDYFQISTYVSSVFIILLGQLWANRKEYRKTLCAMFAGVCILILFPVFPYIFNAFSTINARWMFFLSFLQCVAAAWAIDSIVKAGRLKIKALLACTAISYAVMFLSAWIVSLDGDAKADKFAANLFSTKESMLCLTIFLLSILVLAFIQYYFRQKKNVGRYIFGIGMCVILIADSFANYHSWYTSENSVCEYTAEEQSSYSDASADVIADIMTKDTSWYRIEKNFDSVYDDDGLPSENDAMVQRYYGLKSYNSVNNSNYSAFLKELGIYVANPVSIEYLKEIGMSPKEVTGSQLNYINGTYDRYNVMSYLGVKYYICNDDTLDLPDSLKLIGEKDGLRIYQNENYLPLAFVNSKIIGKQQFQELSDEEKEQVLFEYAVLDSDEIGAKDINTINLQDSAEKKQNAFKLSSFSQDKVQFNISVKEDGYLNLTIPYNKDWHIYIDGEETETECVNIGLLGCKIESGAHEVTVKYIPKTFIIGLVIFIILLCGLLILRKRAGKIVDRIENIVIRLEEKTEVVLPKAVHNEKVLSLMKYGIWTAAAGLASFGFVYCLVNIKRGDPVFPLSMMEKGIFAAVFIGVWLIGYTAAKYIQKKAPKQGRESGIELCRIICMLLIIAHHCVIHGGSFQMDGMGTNKVLALMILPAGKIGFDCFVAISCWFLVEKQFKMQRFLRIWLETLFYSVLLAVPAVMLRGDLSWKNLSAAFFPINGNSHGFAAAYMAFYLLLPFIAKMTSNLSKFGARWLMYILLYLEVISQIFGVINNYRQPFASEILLFMLCYVIALNLKKWPVKIMENKRVLLGLIFGIWFVLFVGRYLYAVNAGNMAAIYMISMLYDESSITNIIAGFAMMFLFKQIKLPYMPVINYLSLSTLGILLLHDHNYFRNILWHNIIGAENWYGSPHFLIMVLAMTFLIYGVGMVIDRFRDKFLEKNIFKQRKVQDMCAWFDEKINEK